MTIYLRNGKGAKDRQVPLHKTTLQLLRSYFKTYRPKTYLFNGQNKEQYSSKSIRSIIKVSVRKSGIKKNVTPHTLRHSYATHLLESGVDLRIIQTILGHNNVKTTELYTHVSKSYLSKTYNPLEDIKVSW